MERARRLASPAILRRLMTESKQSQPAFSNSNRCIFTYSPSLHQPSRTTTPTNADKHHQPSRTTAHSNTDKHHQPSRATAPSNADKHHQPSRTTTPTNADKHHQPSRTTAPSNADKHHQPSRTTAPSNADKHHQPSRTTAPSNADKHHQPSRTTAPSNADKHHQPFRTTAPSNAYKHHQLHQPRHISNSIRCIYTYSPSLLQHQSSRTTAHSNADKHHQPSRTTTPTNADKHHQPSRTTAPSNADKHHQPFRTTAPSNADKHHQLHHPRHISNSISCNFTYSPSLLHHQSSRTTAHSNADKHQLHHHRHISTASLQPSDTFARRHNSATPDEQTIMASLVGFPSTDALIDATVPKSIRAPPLKFSKFDEGLTESQMVSHMQRLASMNKAYKSFIGMGYYGTHVPAVILRNIMENPGWYTQYTPYQAEIAQGRLESLLNFQTLITDLTALPMSNASLLDEATAAAEAMAMCNNIQRSKKKTFIIASNCHPQTIDVCKTRAEGFDLKVVVSDLKDFDYSSGDVCGVLVQYPGTEGEVLDYEEFVKNAHATGVKVVMSTDLLALTVLKPPGEIGADIVVGSAQRFGVPMGYGGPHAAFLATSQEYKRLMPGRIIGLSMDSTGKQALRMAMQTREQHIRRDKATSNICTAQALLANMAAMYAVYHGPEGLKAIANRVHGLAGVFAHGLKKLGTVTVQDLPFFDTVKVTCADAKAIADLAVKHEMNLRIVDSNTLTVAFDETTTLEDVDTLFKVFNGGKPAGFTAESLAPEVDSPIPAGLARQSPYLTHQIFNMYHTEHELLRYLHKLQAKDLSLCHSMIPLGSCTMKLNATAEMIPVTFPNFANIHPFVPVDQAAGYQEMFDDLGDLLCKITGFDSFSLQPNAGAAGEYAGLMVIRKYHQARGDHHRNVCIIPVSAHGTNPASAAMCGMKIVAVGTDSKGNINIEELRKAAESHKENLSALMVTYPSTHGVYEEGIDEICKIIHDNGGQVYMDGANMNAQVGLTSPGFIGADVCHLNLHKTFCIPHGGGGPGMGPIGVKKHLAPFLPSHPVVATGGIPATENAAPLGTISAAPWGSALILPISYTYIAMMGSGGLTDASKIAILNANYMAKRLENYFPVLFRGVNGTCAHEFIIDLRGFKATAGIEPEDVAKRLMDYGFHAPTMSWPVPGTLMIEPTESETKAEMDRFCDALISIREEIGQIESGKADIQNNVLKGAPHPPSLVMGDTWTKPYSREYAAFPAVWLREAKFWPTTGRVDNVYGDRNLICTLLPVSQMAEEAAAATA